MFDHNCSRCVTSSSLVSATSLVASIAPTSIPCSSAESSSAFQSDYRPTDVSIFPDDSLISRIGKYTICFAFWENCATYCPLSIFSWYWNVSGDFPRPYCCNHVLSPPKLLVFSSRLQDEAQECRVGTIPLCWKTTSMALTNSSWDVF